MNRFINLAMSLGGLVAACVAAVQIHQLVGGQAAPDLLNYAITTLTSASAIGLTSTGWWRTRNAGAACAPDERALTAALDQLFAHFPDDAAAQEAVRVVARAVTERRYQKVEKP